MKPGRPAVAKEVRASQQAQIWPVDWVIVFFSVGDGDAVAELIRERRAERSERHCFVREAASVEKDCV
jgi:hypothetical protein